MSVEFDLILYYKKNVFIDRYGRDKKESFLVEKGRNNLWERQKGESFSRKRNKEKVENGLSPASTPSFFHFPIENASPLVLSLSSPTLQSQHTHTYTHTFWHFFFLLLFWNQSTTLLQVADPLSLSLSHSEYTSEPGNGEKRTWKKTFLNNYYRCRCNGCLWDWNLDEEGCLVECRSCPFQEWGTVWLLLCKSEVLLGFSLIREHNAVVVLFSLRKGEEFPTKKKKEKEKKQKKKNPNPFLAYLLVEGRQDGARHNFYKLYLEKKWKKKKKKKEESYPLDDRPFSWFFFFFCYLFLNGKSGSFLIACLFRTFDIFPEVKKQMTVHQIMAMQSGRSEKMEFLKLGVYIYILFVYVAVRKPKFDVLNCQLWLIVLDNYDDALCSFAIFHT